MKDLARDGRNPELGRRTERPEVIHAGSFTRLKPGFRMTPSVQ